MFHYNAAIFDLDGTLIDSLDVWRKVDVAFLKKRNLTMPKGYTKAVASMNFPEAARYTISQFHLNESVESVMAEWHDMVAYEYGNHIFLKPHTREYLNRLKKQGIKLGVATSLPQSLYTAVLSNNKILDCFDALSSTDEVKCGKAYPDLYLLEAQKLKTPPGECISFDDLLIGIQGSQKAGMWAVGVYDPHSKEGWDVVQKTADRFIYDFSEMIEEK